MGLTPTNTLLPLRSGLVPSRGCGGSVDCHFWIGGADSVCVLPEVLQVEINLTILHTPHWSAWPEDAMVPMSFAPDLGSVFNADLLSLDPAGRGGNWQLQFDGEFTGPPGYQLGLCSGPGTPVRGLLGRVLITYSCSAKSLEVRMRDITSYPNATECPSTGGSGGHGNNPYLETGSSQSPPHSIVTVLRSHHMTREDCSGRVVEWIGPAARTHRETLWGRVNTPGGNHSEGACCTTAASSWGMQLESALVTW